MKGFTKSRSSQNPVAQNPENFDEEIEVAQYDQNLGSNSGCFLLETMFKKMGHRPTRGFKEFHRHSNCGECNPNVLILKVWKLFRMVALVIPVPLQTRVTPHSKSQPNISKWWCRSLRYNSKLGLPLIRYRSRVLRLVVLFPPYVHNLLAIDKKQFRKLTEPL